MNAKLPSNRRLLVASLTVLGMSLGLVWAGMSDVQAARRLEQLESGDHEACCSTAHPKIPGSADVHASG